jgi:outer membrane protein OmpA-like peptidoglycan-associated protein
MLLLLWLLLTWLFFNWCGCLPIGQGALSAVLTTCENEKTEANNSAQFKLNDAQLILASMKKPLHNEVINYLKKNGKAGVLITGKSDAGEVPTTTLPNLGRLRAEAMRAYFINNGITENRIQVSEAMVSHLDTKAGIVNNAIDFTLLCDLEKAPISIGGLDLKDGNNLIASARQGIAYNASVYNYNTPLEAEVNSFIEKAVAFLKANPNKQLIINGYYHGKEQNNSIYPNLGIARANQVKNLLIARGIPARQFETKGIKLANSFDFSNGYNNAIAFVLGELSEVVKPEMSIKNIVLYFPTGASTIALEEQQRQFFTELTRYLDYYPEQKVTITGHTDNQGIRASNVQLGLQRANFAADYLTKNGINKAQIVTNSKGPDVPIADNNTEEGKAKNRRVEISIL